MRTDPAEKMLLNGSGILSNAELLAILIGSGNRNESAVNLCKRILKDHQNSIDNLSKLSIHELMTYSGIGEAKAISILAALELGRRRKPSSIKKPKLTSSNKIYEYLKSKMIDLTEEVCWIIYLSRGLQVIGTEKIGLGGRSGVIIDPKVVFKKSLDRKASSIVIAHNHPSGQLQPSKEDVRVTKKLTEAGKNLDLPLLDHLIITDQGYYSFRDEGLMD